MHFLIIKEKLSMCSADKWVMIQYKLMPNIYYWKKDLCFQIYT